MNVLVIDVGGTHIKILATGQKNHREFESGPKLTPAMMVSQLKAAGVSDAIAREFVGHDSEEVSNSYTHIPTDILRKAARKLPDILE